jgi:hypothetical protein
MKCSAITFLLSCLLGATLPGAIHAQPNLYPTNDDLRQMCGGGTAETASIEVKIQAEIESLKKASAGADLNAAKRTFNTIIEQLKNDPSIKDVMKIYADCAERLIRASWERMDKRPFPVSRRGSSAALRVTSFASDAEMNNVGRNQAEEDARAKLKEDCGERRFIATGKPIYSQSSSRDRERIYFAEIEGECRIKN